MNRHSCRALGALRSRVVGPSHYVIAALACFAIPHPALAQQAGANADKSQDPATKGLQEIVVTAQKRSENLQKIPVAVTALGRDRIENLQVRNFNDLGGLAPNLTAINSGSGSNPIITLRGIVGGNVEPGRDNGVAMYLDGVYISRTTGAQFDVADLERVEILRGPQGTLYGRNSTGGAINYITAPPKGKLYLRQELSVGDLGLIRAKTRIDLPTFHDISISASYLHDHRDGWVRNSEAGRSWNFSGLPGGYLTGDRTSADRLGSRNADALMIAVRFAPTALPVTIDYKFDWSKAQYTNLAKQVLFDQATAALGVPPRALPATTQPLDSVPVGFITPEHLNVFGHNLTLSANLTDHLQFKSITGYRGFTDEYTNDSGGGGFENYVRSPTQYYFEVQGIADHERDRSLSQEAELTYQSSRVDAVAGIYYFHQHTVTVNPLFVYQYLSPPNLPVPRLSTDADDHNRSVAEFGQATVHLTSRLDVTGGVRATQDKREAATTLTVTPDFRAKFHHIDWTANATYRPTGTLTLYAKAGTGYLTGGYFDQRAFQPEHLLQYEVGMKADWLDRRLRLNLSAFHSTYDDLQQSESNPNPPFLYQTFNVGKARIDGVEAELTALPTDNLTLTANYGFTHFKYLNFTDPVFGDITHLAAPTFDRPKHNINLGAEYHFAEFGGGIRPSINLNARWHSNEALYFLPMSYRMQLAGTFSAAQIAQGAAIDEFSSHNAVWNVDARATLAQVPLGRLKGKTSVWVRNLLDKRVINNAALNIPGLLTGTFMEPRTFGFDFSLEF